MDKKQFDELVVKAGAGDAVALWKVGETYRHGNKKLGVARDEKKGWELIERAKDAGSVVALCLLGKISEAEFLSGLEATKAVDTDGASGANPFGCVEFAELELMNADRFPSIRNVKINAALTWYRRAVKHGVAEPQLVERIAWCLRELGAEEGEEHPVVLVGARKKKIRDSAFFLETTLEDVSIADGVEEIGMHAFRGCKKLRSVKFPASLRRISQGAFSNCPNLTNVSFSEGLEIVDGCAFEGCHALRDVVLPSTLTRIWGGAFHDCSALEKITFPPKITTIECDVLRDCKSLKQVKIPEGVTIIGQGAFKGCASLERIEIPATVKKIMWSAFQDCSNLVGIDLPPLLTELETHSFCGCRALEKIDIPEHVVEIEREVFRGCESLKSITLHEGLKEIGNQAFDGCLSLKEIDLPQSVAMIGFECFASCVNLERFHSSGQLQCDKDAFAKCSKLPQVIADGTLIYSPKMYGDVVITPGVKIIGCHVFRGCHEMTSVNIPDSVISIGIRAFEECSGLKAITIPGHVESIGAGAFEGCRSLGSVEIPPSVQQMGGFAFERCASLQKVTIQYGALKEHCDSDESKYVFMDCPKIEHLVLPCYLEHKLTDWFWNPYKQKLTILNDTDSAMTERSPAEMVTLAEKIELGNKRKSVLSEIAKDVSEGKTILVSALSARAQKQALACGLLLTDIVTYRHEYSYVLHCPCAMQFPALERVSVKVPRSMLSDGEPDYYLVFLDQDREKSWLVLPTEETELPGGGVEVYDSASEAKASRFGALFAVISSARSVGKK